MPGLRNAETAAAEFEAGWAEIGAPFDELWPSQTGTVLSVARDAFKAGAASGQAEVFELRRLLWRRHNPAHFAALYGDDGEMQCSQCMLDFKRDPIERIVRVFLEQAIAAMRTGDPE